MNITTDWFSQHIRFWNEIFKPFKGKPLNYIEIGSFEGLSTVWMLENVLTHPDSTVDSVDPYLPYLDIGDRNMEEVEARFHENIKPYKDKVRCHKMSSFEYLKDRKESADIIYVDGDHSSQGCLIDGVQSHLLLKPGGIIMFDDYLWVGLTENPGLPKSAINAFMNCFSQQYKLLYVGYQVALQKIAVI